MRPRFGVMITSILMIIMAVTFSSAHAQLAELSSTINQLSVAADPQGESIRHLAYDLVPTAYVVSGAIDLPENESALVLAVHGAELSTVSASAAGLEQVQMIRVMVSNDADLASLASLPEFNTTAKLLVICELDLNPSAIAQALGNINDRTIYYSISVPR